MSTIVPLELPGINHCTVGTTGYQPFVYRWNYWISTIVPLDLPDISHFIAGTTGYQPLYRSITGSHSFYRWSFRISTILLLELPNINHRIVGAIALYRSSILYSTVQYRTEQHSKAQHSTARHSTAQIIPGIANEENEQETTDGGVKIDTRTLFFYVKSVERRLYFYPSAGG